MEKQITIRKIIPEDNQSVAKIIRDTLTEFGGNRPGTAYYDYDTDHMYEAYQADGAVYYVAEYEGVLLGGCGIKPLCGADAGYCELQKLYLDSSKRGLGIGYSLVEKSLAFAVESGYRKCYLETFPNMLAAINLYLKFGFKRLKAPLGNTGHCGCDIWMIKGFS